MAQFAVDDFDQIFLRRIRQSHSNLSMVKTTKKKASGSLGLFNLTKRVSAVP